MSFTVIALFSFQVLGIPTFRPDERFAKIWDIVIFWCVTVSIFIETWVFFFANNQETKGRPFS